MAENIEDIVLHFKKLTNEERYEQLSILMKGDALTNGELSWRAELCTALEKAQVYPQEEDQPLR